MVTKIISKIVTAKVLFNSTHTIIPTGIRLNPYTLNDLNAMLHQQNIRKRKSELDHAMRPDLLPPFKELEDLKYGDSIYGLLLQETTDTNFEVF